MRRAEATTDEPATTPNGPIARLAAELELHGWGVLNDLFGAEEIDALASEARALWRDGSLRPAGVGRGAGNLIRSEIRGDSICWLEETVLSPAAACYRTRMEALREGLNRELFLGLASFEAHYAVYPPGAFYSRHLDRFATSDERMISSTLYLNEEWRAGDGGELRLLDPAEGAVEIAPERGRLVVFRSDTIWHEVRPGRQARFSLTGWFRRRPPGTLFG